MSRIPHVVSSRCAPAPRVSVLLPVRDGLPYLEACIASLVRQTVAELEVVAVDDGSADGSGDRLDRWATADPRVRALHRPAEGLVAALNAGLAACRAPIVARMDADDIAHPRRLELQLELLAARPEIGVASCLVRHFPWHDVAEGNRRYERWLNGLVEPDEMARERFVESPVAHPSAAVRRGLLAAVGGYRELGWPEDYDLWLRLAARGVRFAKVPRMLHFWREHPPRLTRVDPRYGSDRFLACKAAHLAEGPLAEASSVVVWGAGRTGRRLARELLARSVEISGFVDIDPAKVGRTVRGRPVLAAETLRGRIGPGTVVLAAVASRGARGLIRSRLGALGLEEGGDFWCVA